METKEELQKNPCDINNEHYYIWVGSDQTMHPDFYCVTCGQPKPEDAPQYQIARYES